jgi:hypothetical protein
MALTARLPLSFSEPQERHSGNSGIPCFSTTWGKHLMEKNHEDREKRLPRRCGARFDVCPDGAFAGRHLLLGAHSLLRGRASLLPCAASPAALLPGCDVPNLCTLRSGRGSARAGRCALHDALRHDLLHGPRRASRLPHSLRPDLPLPITAASVC